MALPAFATATELNARSATSIATDTAEAALVSVATAIRGETERSWVDDEGALVEMTDVVVDILRSVSVEVALRLLRNPEGATQRSATQGERSEAITVEVGGLYFSKSERQQLAWAAGQTYTDDDTVFRGLGTITTTRGPLETAAAWDDFDFDNLDHIEALW